MQAHITILLKPCTSIMDTLQGNILEAFLLAIPRGQIQHMIMKINFQKLSQFTFYKTKTLSHNFPVDVVT